MSKQRILSPATALVLLCFTLLTAASALPADELEQQAAEAQQRQAEEQQRLAEKQAALAETERALEQAARTMDEVRQAIATNRMQEEEEVRQMREELSRAHRQMREASREIAQAHRELERSEALHERVRVINLGDRPVIGVVLGESNTEGVRITGVSPDGPADKAGIRQNDVLIAIGGVELAGRSDGSGSRALLEVMQSVEEGEQLAVTVNRDDELLDVFVVPEQREPLSWQSMLRLPAPPAPPGAPGAPSAPQVIVERIEIPEFDEEELARHIEEVTEQARNFEIMFIGDDGERIEFSEDYSFAPEALSHLGELAMLEAETWFGPSVTRGLELTSLNADLGKYFRADSGVLVIQAREDNAYGLESGDVIQEVGGAPMTSPADFLRALRDAEPGAEIDIAIKRDRKNRTLSAVVPENRLGLIDLHKVHSEDAPHAVQEFISPD